MPCTTSGLKKVWLTILKIVVKAIQPDVGSFDGLKMFCF